MRYIKSKQLQKILFEYEDLKPIGSQFFIVKGLKTNNTNYQEFYVQALEEISKMDTSLNFEDNSESLYNTMGLEEGKKLLDEIYAYLKINIKDSKYDFLYGTTVLDFIKIRNEAMCIA